MNRGWAQPERTVKLEIRKMEEGDIPAVASLEREIFARPWSEKSFRNAVLSPDNCYFAAVSGEDIVGYCGLWCAGDCGDLCNLAVSEKFRGQSLGELLLRRGLEDVARRGVLRVLLEVRRSNVPAISLYRKLGFAQIGVRAGYYSQPREDGILMERVL